MIDGAPRARRRVDARAVIAHHHVLAGLVLIAAIHADLAVATHVMGDRPVARVAQMHARIGRGGVDHVVGDPVPRAHPIRAHDPLLVVVQVVVVDVDVVRRVGLNRVGVLGAAALHDPLELVVRPDLGAVGGVLDPIAAPAGSEGRVHDLHPVAADRARPAPHDRQPPLVRGMPDVAPRIAVKDQIQRRGARRHLDRPGERHPPDRHVAHAGPETAARHRRRRPRVGRHHDHPHLAPPPNDP